MTLADVTAELAKRAEEHDREASFPYPGVKLVHRHGLLTATVAERYGGAGGGLRRTADGWSISGRKIFSTGAEALSWMLVWARVDDGAASFAVRGGSPGGNNALNRRNPLERHLRDVLCARIHTPQDDTILTTFSSLNGVTR